MLAAVVACSTYAAESSNKNATKKSSVYYKNVYSISLMFICFHMIIRILIFIILHTLLPILNPPTLSKTIKMLFRTVLLMAIGLPVAKKVSCAHAHDDSDEASREEQEAQSQSGVLAEPSSVTNHLVNNLATAAVSVPSMHEQVGQSQSELDMGILSGDKSVKEVIDGLGATSNTRGLRKHKKKSSSSSWNKKKSSKTSKRGESTKDDVDGKPTSSPTSSGRTFSPSNVPPPIPPVGVPI